METITYSDGATPQITYDYDRRGRRATIERNGMATTLAYNDAGQVIGETYVGGPLDGLSVALDRDQYLRRGGASVGGLASGMAGYTYSYDAGSGRLERVTDGAGNYAAYDYLANSQLTGQITHGTETNVRLTTTKTYDRLNRLVSVMASTDSAAPDAWAYLYQHNEANQRVRVTLADGSYWVYQYDRLGQVKSGKRYWGDGVPVAGQQFEYGFDDIGNRTATQAGGDERGGSLRLAAYTANSLNQYTGREVPGTNDIVGLAGAGAAVTVNGSAAYRRGEYFHHPLALANQAGAVREQVTVTSTLNGYTPQSDNTGKVFLAPRQESFTHDLDGNLLADGRWDYVWDGENRLIGMAEHANSPGNSRRALGFDYDWQGRRISKSVSNWVAGAWQFASRTNFLYDGWNLLAEVDGARNLVRAYTWGLDLSGTVEEAGGVGGLVAMADCATGSPATYFVVSDGNGNVTGLVNGADGAVAAVYEYGPFGEGIRASGPASAANPLRFSTKYQDGESGFSCYGFRYYNSSTGRWLSRDPIEEKGGLNLYCMLENDPINATDVLGLWIKINGDIWQAEYGDTLEGLASKDQYGGNSLNWPCLWPVGDTKNHGYPSISTCDKYDASNLVVPNREKKLEIIADSNLAGDGGSLKMIFPDAEITAGYQVASRIRKVSSEGGTPISAFVLAGHNGTGGIVKGFSSYFYLSDLLALDKKPTFRRAKNKKGPVRCWFTRDATARFYGCGSDRIAYPFADNVLRVGSRSLGINKNPVGSTAIPVDTIVWDPVYSSSGKFLRWDSMASFFTAPIWITFYGAL